MDIINMRQNVIYVDLSKTNIIPLFLHFTLKNNGLTSLTSEERLSVQTDRVSLRPQPVSSRDSRYIEKKNQLAFFYMQMFFLAGSTRILTVNNLIFTRHSCTDLQLLKKCE